MVKIAPIAQDQLTAESRELSPEWSVQQRRLAEESGLALLLVEGHQPPALVVSNNNSICEAIQSSAEHAALCAPYCGEAHQRALSGAGPTHYRCHAGLHCFAAPVQLGNRTGLAMIAGRTFLSTADYRSAAKRFSEGDLSDIPKHGVFDNVIFSSREVLDGLAERLERTVRDYNAQITVREPSHTSPEASETRSTEPELQQEIARLQEELNSRTRFNESLQYFLERISSTDPEATYLAILNNSRELLHAERASLFVFNETKNELNLRAAIGIPAATSEVQPINIGEGISGAAWLSGKPIIVSDMEAEGLPLAPRERQYKTRSFISYPIIINGRKVGLLNLTDKEGGGVYDEVDFSLLEIIAPQVALALERAGWQEKATQFQLMSITDPLTGLPNRRYLEERLAEEVNRSKRYGHEMSFLMIDIDDFKVYNDRNGHQAGDLALQMTAHALRVALRSADVAARYGGEEFCILLPQTSLAEARVIAERVREKIQDTPYPHGRSQPLGAVTISTGISTLSNSIDTAEQVIWAADRALYEAKDNGKNRIRSYEEVPLKAVTVNGS
jgi:diguanylate cyclase (GGDEF)-like protein